MSSKRGEATCNSNQRVAMSGSNTHESKPKVTQKNKITNYKLKLQTLQNKAKKTKIRKKNIKQLRRLKNLQQKKEQKCLKYKKANVEV